MKTTSLNNERTGLIVVAAAGGFVCGYFCSRYLSSKGNVPETSPTVDEHREDDTVSLADTPRSMDSSASLAFQQKSSRFSHPDGSSADHGIANGDSSSGSSVDTKMALLVRLDLAMSVGELVKHSCTASIGQYKKLFKIKAPELKQWEKGGMKKDCYGVNSEESLVKAREAARQAGFPTRGVMDGEERLVQVMIGPGPGAKLSQLLSGTAEPML